MATAAPSSALRPAPWRVEAVEQETADTRTLTLAPLAGTAPAVEPGQFVMVSVPGVGEVPISVSRLDPLCLTVRAVGAVTRAVCASAPGAVLGVRGPYGSAWPLADTGGGDVVVVAGGIGLAPLRPVVLRLLERHDLDRLAVLYGARTPHDLLYARSLLGWGARVTVDAAGGEWHGKVGVVPKLLAGVRLDPTRTTAFVCGPELMMRFTIAALSARGVAAERIHLSLERCMRCGVGLCGHCQLGPTLVCRDGPVYSYAAVAPLLEVREL